MQVQIQVLHKKNNILTGSYIVESKTAYIRIIKTCQSELIECVNNNDFTQLHPDNPIKYMSNYKRKILANFKIIDFETALKYSQVFAKITGNRYCKLVAVTNPIEFIEI